MQLLSQPCLQHFDGGLGRDLRAELDQRTPRQRQALEPLAQRGHLYTEAEQISKLGQASEACCIGLL